MITARDVALGLGADIVRMIGDGKRRVTRVAPLSDLNPGTLGYIKSADSVPADLDATGSTLICAPAVAEQIGAAGATLLVSPNPRLAFMRAIDRFFPAPTPARGIHPRAVVDPEASIDPTASIGACAVVGRDCVVGARTIIHPNVTIYGGVRIGADVVIHSGTVVGADGFGYERSEDGSLEKFPHVGGVVIEDGVEIGSNSSIDRGSLGDTVIKARAKVDNLCHISHNVVVGSDSAVIAQSMVGGSVVIGDRAWLAPAAIVINQCRIGRGATVGLGAVVVKHVEPETTVMGSPAVPADEFRRQRQAMKVLLSRSG
jgi:UDP-3-O-[3-hydroxymyristoyl] glucosamine N-acyltransferase